MSFEIKQFIPGFGSVSVIDLEQPHTTTGSFKELDALKADPLSHAYPVRLP